ncbi:MAG TPA: (Fe-S)-binding protein [Acidimicrobiales bacterium]|nr:(Fe-S)-binding protein [Acidimicrobiales bacterium]
MRVALFITCFNDTLCPETGQATVKLLERLGQTVDFPDEQTCCGQMHHNSGHRSEAVNLMRRFVDVFAHCEAVVAPSASCAAMVKHHYPLLAEGTGDRALQHAVEQLGRKTWELSEFIVDRLGVTDVHAYFPHRVTYHPTCHSLRQLRVDDKPLRLLQHVRGIDLVALPRADECCGFGGTFAIKNAAVSTAMMSDKLHHIRSTGATVCTALDNSCLVHIGGGLSRMKVGVRTVHLAEILASTAEDHQ